jgi:hypothetical protein
VDVANKKMGIGRSNMHWYQRGFDKIFNTPWLNHSCYTHHPDGKIPVTGVELSEVDDMLKCCIDAHKKLFPGVPIAGWDVCLVDGEPRICFLEVNLMCNFFKGSFDKDKYVRPSFSSQPREKKDIYIYVKFSYSLVYFLLLLLLLLLLQNFIF